MSEIKYLNIQDLKDEQAQLCELLAQCVQDGASLGFLTKESKSHYDEYWSAVAKDIQKHKTFLWAALQSGEIVGTVQLVRATKANALHRAEIEKLMVHPKVRQRVIAHQLLTLAEDKTKHLNLKLLVLDTRTGDVSEKLYEKFNFIKAGIIPQFALSHTGTIDSTTLFYKLLV